MEALEKPLAGKAARRTPSSCGRPLPGAHRPGGRHRGGGPSPTGDHWCDARSRACLRQPSAARGVGVPGGDRRRRVVHHQPGVGKLAPTSSRAFFWRKSRVAVSRCRPPAIASRERRCDLPVLGQASPAAGPGPRERVSRYPTCRRGASKPIYRRSHAYRRPRPRSPTVGPHSPLDIPPTRPGVERAMISGTLAACDERTPAHG